MEKDYKKMWEELQDKLRKEEETARKEWSGDVSEMTHIKMCAMRYVLNKMEDLEKI